MQCLVRAPTRVFAPVTRPVGKCRRISSPRSASIKCIARDLTPTKCSSCRVNGKPVLHDAVTTSTGSTRLAAKESSESLSVGLAAAVLLATCMAASCDPANASQLRPTEDLDSLAVSMPAFIAMLPGPQASEFWENVGRFIVYFFTVLTGGFFSLVRPIINMLRSPSSAILIIVALGGGFFLTYITLASMLGLEANNSYDSFLYGQ